MKGRYKIMSMKIDTALQDINIIKETLEDTKVHYRGMYLMCFLMASLNGVKDIWMLLEMRYMPAVMAGHFIGIYIYPLLLAVSYLYIYRKEKKYSNKYYLSMIGIWGFMASVIPAAAALTNTIGCVAGMDRSYDAAGQMRGSDFIESITNIVLFSVFLIICAYILNKRIFMALAVLNLLCYMFLEQYLTSEGIPFPMKGQAQAKLVYSSVYSIAVTCLGYAVLGSVLYWKSCYCSQNNG